MGSTLIEVLRDRALNQPDATAYVFLANGSAESARLSYGQLDLRARAVAAMVAEKARRGERVLLLYPAGLEFLDAFFGCLYAGTIGVPLPAPDQARLKHTLPRLLTVAADTGAKLVLTTRGILALRAEICLQIPALAQIEWLAVEEIPDSSAQTWIDPVVGKEDVAYLQYSSGSTSQPKGIMISHANAIHNVGLILSWGKYAPASVSVSWLPHFHDYGLVHGILAPLCNGGTCYLLSPLAFLKRPMRWLQAISRYKAATTQGPTFGYDYCARKVRAEDCADLDLSHWVGAGISAEPIHIETMERFTETFRPFGFRKEAFCPGYGLAEATLVVTTDLPGEPLFQVTPDAEAAPGARAISGSGRLLPEVPVRIVDSESCVPCPPGAVGEIWCAGESIALGYWNRPEESEKTFRATLATGEPGTWLRTGDLGFIADERLYVTGRLKDLIVLAGANHYPQDIEWTVEAAHPDIRHNCSAAFSIEVEGRERLVVVAEAKIREDELAAVHSAIRRAIAERHEIDVYEIAIVRPGGVSKTSSGKVQRSDCRARFLAGTLDAISPARPAAVHAAPTRSSIREWLRARFAAVARIDPGTIDDHQPLAQYGMTSIEAVSAVAELEDWLKRELSPTLLYQYPTIDALSAWLTSEADAAAPLAPVTPAAANEPIAIVGIGCRFPGAHGPEAFWRMLAEGTDMIREVPADRWDVDAFYSAGGIVPGRMNTRWGGFIEGAADFDPQFFGISPREATRIDPQQRVLMETAYEALEAAGIVPERVAGSDAGVFVGISTSDYAQMQAGEFASLDTYSTTGSALSIAANRLSYTFDFRGPSISVDTACSSSLTAVYLACESLRRGQSSLALAGGVNLILTPECTVAASQAGMMSPDGHCKAFDSQANGYVRGEGCGVVVLKRLSDAMRDRDPIVAVIRGIAVNQDGRSNGLTAPNPLQQQQVIRLALRDAGVSSREIDYVEAHGTGTRLGDPIEFQALSATVGQERESGKPCLIGSVKTNIGHLEAAAGLAGLIKVALSLSHEQIPPHLGIHEINPYIRVEGSGLQIATQPAAWTRNGRPRRAGVSSFGVGGANAHAVLEEAPFIEPKRSARTIHLLTISAKTRPALLDLVQRYEELLERDDRFAEIAYTSNVGRSQFAERITVVAGSSREALRKLREKTYDDAVQREEFSEDGDFTKVSLPSYPFQRRRYWLDIRPKSRETVKTSAAVHPLLGSALKSPVLRDTVYQSQLSSSSPSFLADHNVYGRAVVPASAFFEMALAGLKGRHPFSVTDCDIKEALVLSEDNTSTSVQTIFTGDLANRASFQIFSLKEDGESWRLHASGELRREFKTPSIESISLSEVQARCKERMSGAELYSFLKQLNLGYGPAFQGVTEVWRRKGEALGRIRQPDSSKNSELSIAQPTLMDACFHVIVAAHEYEGIEEAYVPMHLDAMDVYGPVPEEFWVRAMVRSGGPRHAGVVTADLYLFDEKGKVFAEFTKLTCMRLGREKLLGAAARDDYRDWLYRLEWQTKESDFIDGQLDDGQWLILADRGGVGESIRGTLEAQGQRVTCVYNDADIVIQSTPELPLRGAIHLWALDGDDDQSRLCGAALRVVKAIADAHLTVGPRLCMVTRCAAMPAGATLWGFTNVLTAEHPELRPVAIDLDAQPAGNEALFIAEEVLTNDGESRVALRKGLRYVQRLARIKPPNSSPERPALKSDATYLITGGLGALGLKLARWMVERGARSLVLAGRSAASGAAQSAIDELRQGGAEILVSQLDIADSRAVADLVDRIENTMMPLRGILHAAGVLDDGVAVQQDWPRFQAVLRPKVEGAWNLHAQTLKLPLDFFVLFSSAAAFLPNVGQSSYAAANAFLDSLAHFRKGLGLPALSVNWGLWAGPGIAQGTGAQEILATYGVGAIRPEQGLRAFDFLFQSEDAEAAVLPVDWQKYFSHFRAGAEPKLLSRLAADVRDRSEDEELRKRRDRLLQRLQEATESERQEQVEDFIAEQVMEVLGFASRDEVDFSVGFFEIGLDSMMAVELQSRIQTGLGISIPATTAFDQPNITALARYLLDNFLVFEAPVRASEGWDALFEEETAVFEPAGALRDF